MFPSPWSSKWQLPKGFPYQNSICMAHLRIPVTCAAHHNFLHSTLLIILSRQYKSQRSSLCSILTFPLGPNITLFMFILLNSFWTENNKHFFEFHNMPLLLPDNLLPLVILTHCFWFWYVAITHLAIYLHSLLVTPCLPFQGTHFSRNKVTSSPYTYNWIRPLNFIQLTFIRSCNTQQETDSRKKKFYFLQYSYREGKFWNGVSKNIEHTEPKHDTMYFIPAEIKADLSLKWQRSV